MAGEDKPSPSGSRGHSKMQFKPKATPRTKEAAKASTKAAEAEQRREQQTAARNARAQQQLKQGQGQGRKPAGKYVEPAAVASGPFAFGPVSGENNGSSRQRSSRQKAAATNDPSTPSSTTTVSRVKQEEPAASIHTYEEEDEDDDDDDDGIPRIDLTHLQDYDLTSPNLLPISLPRLHTKPDEDLNEEASRKHLGAAFKPTSGGFLFFQLPAVLPKLTPTIPSDEDDKSEAYPPPNGTIGHLNIHRSGRTSITWGKQGDIKFQVHRGSQCNFLQDIVVVDAVHQKKACLIGPVTDRFIVAPYI